MRSSGISLFIFLFAFSTQAQVKLPPKQSENKPPVKTSETKPNTEPVLVIKVTTDISCKFYVDGEYTATINADEVKKVSLKKGEYLFKAVSTANPADVFKEMFTISKEDVEGEKFYEISLQTAISNRLKEEHNERMAAAKIEAEKAATKKAAQEEADRKAAKETEAKLKAEAELAIVASIEKDMVLVEGGTFIMGYSEKEEKRRTENEYPPHNVTLSSFHLNKYEITQEQWQAVMGNNPSKFSGCPGCPVEQVSWDEIQQFIIKLNSLTGKNYRLPTEAEWEYASRGGNKSNGFIYSGSNDLNAVAWFGDNSGGKTHPVGQKQPNELGFYDMSGNVFECCSDFYDKNYYNISPEKNPKGPEKSSCPLADCRSARGSSWIGNNYYCHNCNRYFFTVGNFRNYIYGFRLACD